MFLLPISFRSRLAAKAAAAAFGAISVGATAVGAPAPAVVPTPTSASVPWSALEPGTEGTVDVEWLQRLLTCVEYLCRLMGCAQAVTLDDVNAAIQQLAHTVTSGGVPRLPEKERSEAIAMAMTAGACADEHPEALGTNYDTLRQTLDVIVSQLAGGRPS